MAWFLGLTACRSTDTDQTLQTGGVALVDVNLTGTDYASAEGTTPQASIKTNDAFSNNTAQYKTVLLTPSSFIDARLEPSTNSAASSSQASFVPSSMVVVSGNKLGNGNKFRIIAYRATDGVYKDSKDYTIGLPAASLTLDQGVAYNLVAYSFGSTSALPTITSGETTNLSSAQVAYNNTNRDFMYQR
ncbi:hypothetical protein [Elizabethkingia anophelis]|uniref:hypothetical protein n=1 Tax=Elizabethkingia anophelis TaxID=1117645 RepID=UPI003461861F